MGGAGPQNRFIVARIVPAFDGVYDIHMTFRSVLLPAFALFLAASAPPALSMNAAMEAQLEKLDPETRLEQRCDVEAMERIARDRAGYAVDKVLAYAFSDPVAKADAMRADGAAFRSHERWYRLSYACRTDADHIKVLSFRYSIGAEVPRAEWAKHYLVP